MILQEIRWEDMDWIYVAQDRDSWLAVLEPGNETSGPINAGNLLTS